MLVNARKVTATNTHFGFKVLAPPLNLTTIRTGCPSVPLPYTVGHWDTPQFLRPAKGCRCPTR